MSEVDYLVGAEGDVLASPLLKNALQNLFKNSVEAMEGCEEKRLTVVLESRDNRLILVVKDTGCGMSDAVKERMWERGYTTKETGDGHRDQGRHASGIESSVRRGIAVRRIEKKARARSS
ncbi:MAG: ATP-binding protein [Planctomycetota bacterium]|nr:ATP-binding protein [Planctomycetota bacterium]